MAVPTSSHKSSPSRLSSCSKKLLEMTPRRSSRLNSPATVVNSNGPGLKRCRESPSRHLEEECTTPKSKRLRTELETEKSPSRVRRSLNLQGSENGVLSNGENIENKRSPCKGTVGKENKQSMASAVQTNGIGSTRSPKKVTRVEADVSRSPKSPRKKLNNVTNQIPNWNPTDSSHILAVKTALHLSEVPKSLICREEEQKKLFDFCKTCIEKEKVGSMYVCGCPGTGKSLLLEKVKSLSVEWAKEARIPPPVSVVVNCTSLTNTSDIFKRILEQCQGRKKNSTYSSPFEELKSLLCQKKKSDALKMTLLIVDEMDFLISRDQSVLYDLFRLPSFPNSQCMLIGISNAIDLTDRFLPKLQSLNCKPLVMTFRAYSKDQILKILQQRLKGLPFQAFQPQALELCARKVAAASGDMRKALHVCRDAVEMLQAELADAVYSSDKISFEKLPSHPSLSIEGKLTKQEMHVVRIDHMARALARTFRSAVVDTIQSLPQHQQIVLCSAVKFFRRGKKDATLGELNAAYLDFCKATSMHPLTGPEFSSMCRVLSDQALLNLGQSREDRLRRVTLKVDEGDVIFALQGIRFFRNCLQ
ncbi:cell division control protein 6 homolog B [Cryptomeria japonica]|uniref:cell division control protein 6 homolog B n=1 Tax=Cryptomeria japonica TaxID=3369 RepID=UPI0027D9E18E|nr:cell division control protein 6 homolog B [Cryptomeria japonica]